MTTTERKQTRHYYIEHEPYWYRGKRTGVCGMEGLRTQDKTQVTCKKCLKWIIKAEGK